MTGRRGDATRRGSRSTTHGAPGAFVRIFSQGFFFAGVGDGAGAAGFASLAA